MKSLKEILQQSQQKSYMLGKVFEEGTWVKNSDGEIGKIHRRGVNYVIAVTEEGKMFRSWVKDIKQVDIVETINKGRTRSTIFKNEKTRDNN